MFGFFKRRSEKTKQPFQLSNIIEILQDGVCITDTEGKILYLNKSGKVLLGLETGADYSEVNFLTTSLQSSPALDNALEKLKEKGSFQNLEIPLKPLIGETRETMLTANLIVDLNQESIGYLFLIKDINDFKKIQEQLLQGQKLESVGLMASGIAHDFNNLLSAIIPNAELIKFTTEADDENHHRADVIVTSAQRASEISQRLLAFTRQENYNYVRIFFANEIVLDTIELVKHGKPKNVKLVSNLEEDLPPIKGDPAQLQQVVLNLIINAFDAMPEGGEVAVSTKLIVLDEDNRVAGAEPGEYILLSVKDQGTGIPVEILPKIFDPFFTTKEVGKGTGLGLSQVYGIMKSMNGYIDVKTKEGQGTRFDLYFPPSKEAVPKKVVKPEVGEDEKLKILLVDDEEYVLNILGDILEYLGHESMRFLEGESAVNYFKENYQHVHYAIVDVRMPRMDGIKTVKLLHDIKPELPVIFTSGFEDGMLDKKDMQGIIGFLRKPYSVNTIARDISKLIG
ncbi:MAG: hypothetical protein Kow0037_26260 [Calditrichia bacterium]